MAVKHNYEPTDSQGHAMTCSVCGDSISFYESRRWNVALDETCSGPPDGSHIYLDDERRAPAGWLLCRWPEEVIAAIEKGGVTDVSLDWYLGEDNCAHNRTGMDVLTWLKTKVIEPGFRLPRIVIHSGHEDMRWKMKAEIREVYRLQAEHREQNSGNH